MRHLWNPSHQLIYMHLRNWYGWFNSKKKVLQGPNILQFQEAWFSYAPRPCPWWFACGIFLQFVPHSCNIMPHLSGDTRWQAKFHRYMRRCAVSLFDYGNSAANVTWRSVCWLQMVLLVESIKTSTHGNILARLKVSKRIFEPHIIAIPCFTINVWADYVDSHHVL